jgi:hypothetical protein
VSRAALSGNGAPSVKFKLIFLLHTKFIFLRLALGGGTTQATMAAFVYVAFIDKFNDSDKSTFGGVIVKFVKSKVLAAKFIPESVTFCHHTCIV